MKRTQPVGLLAIVCCLLADPAPRPAAASPTRGSVGQITGVTEPLTRQVVQRRDDNLGNILFIGTYSGDIDGFQAMSIVRPGMSGTPLGWTDLIDVGMFEGHFFGIFRQPAGGFYDLQIRPVHEGQVGEPVSVFAIGVGEVFITAGQSNSTSNGTPTGFLPSLKVSCFDDGPQQGIDPTYPGAFWRWGYDPQPAVDNATGGSVWPTMATNLSNALGVPVGMYAAGCGGTSVEEWLPDTVLFARLIYAIQYFSERGGARAILWDQGETDYLGLTQPATYQANLATVIDQSRALTGVPVKWMVAQAASCLTDNLPQRTGLEQAQAAMVDGELTFLGPDTDGLGLAYRIEVPGGPLHFNAAGLELLGANWGMFVADTPGFLAPGLLPPPD